VPKTYAPEAIPDLGVQLPAGNYILAIESVGDDQPTSTHKYQIRAVLRVVEPAAFANMPHYENFVVGTDTDMEADDPESWKGVAAQRYRDMMLKSGIEPTGSTESDFATLQGQHVGAIVQQEVQAATNRDGSPNKYAGRVQSRVARFFHPGEHSTGVSGDNGSPAPAPQAKGAAGAAAAAKAATAPVASPKPAPAAAVPKAQPVKCPVCNTMVPKTEFVKHIGTHSDTEE